MNETSSKHNIRLNELLDIAQKLFYRKGYEHTSIQDILNSAGIAKGTFYHYFDSKEDLLDRLVIRFNSAAFSCVESIMEEKIPPVKKFEKVFRSIRDIKVENVELMIALMSFMYDDSNILLKKKMNDSFFDFLSPILTVIIDEGIRDGSIESPDPEITSEIILSLFLKYGEQIVPLWNQAPRNPGIIVEIERRMRILIFAVEKMLGLPEETIQLIDPDVIDYFKNKSIHKE